MSKSSSHFTEEVPPPLIGALLRRPHEVVRARMLERLHEAGFTDLEPAHLNVFQYPGPHGARPSELAGRLRISKQALNYLLGQLERLGYLERESNPGDLRSKRIVVTRRGEAAIGVIRDAVTDVETSWAKELGAERFRRLRSLLVALNELT